MTLILRPLHKSLLDDGRYAVGVAALDGQSRTACVVVITGPDSIQSLSCFASWSYHPNHHRHVCGGEPLLSVVTTQAYDFVYCGDARPAAVRQQAEEQYRRNKQLVIEGKQRLAELERGAKNSAMVC